MFALSTVVWGPTDALKRDKKFSEKWIEPDEIKNCLHSDNWLISGEKGAGKSAIRRALVEIYGDRYFVAPVVDFDDISFKALYEHLVELASTTKLSKTATLSHIWHYAIVIELLTACARRAPEHYGYLLASLPAGRADISMAERLLKLLEDAWNKIDEFTGAQPLSSKAQRANLIASGGLTAKLLHQLSQFPLSDEFEALKIEFFGIVEAQEHRLLLVLDGFDRLKNDGTRSDATRLIFASLVDAIQSIHSDPHLPPTLEIKAFIPHDRYLSLPLRDSDKIDTMHVSIRWTRDNLQAFLKRRLNLALKNQYATFLTAWHQVMPASVINSGYSLEEDSFDYLVRHSMMRPRQLQIYLEHLASEYQDRIIEPSMVPHSIRETSKQIAKFFVDEFRTDHPNLARFIASLHRKDNVMEYKDFRLIIGDAIAKFHGPEEELTVEAKVDTLYAMGFFGVVNFFEAGSNPDAVYCPPTRESRRHFVDFFYKTPHPSISVTLRNDSVIAVHPVFVHYCNLRPHSSLIVG